MFLTGGICTAKEQNFYLLKIGDEVNMINTDKMGTVEKIEKRYNQSPIYLVKWLEGNTYWVDEKIIAYKEWKLRVTPDKVTKSETKTKKYLLTIKDGYHSTGTCPKKKLIIKYEPEVEGKR